MVHDAFCCASCERVVAFRTRCPQLQLGEKTALYAADVVPDGDAASAERGGEGTREATAAGAVPEGKAAQVVLVLFTEPWCPFCRVQSAALRSLAEGSSGSDSEDNEAADLLFAEIDLLRFPLASPAAGAVPVPFLAAYRDGARLMLDAGSTSMRTEQGLLVGECAATLDLVVQRIAALASRGRSWALVL